MKAPVTAEIHASAGMSRAGLPDPSPMNAAALAAGGTGGHSDSVGAGGATTAAAKR